MQIYSQKRRENIYPLRDLNAYFFMCTMCVAFISLHAVTTKYTRMSYTEICRYHDLRYFFSFLCLMLFIFCNRCTLQRSTFNASETKSTRNNTGIFRNRKLKYVEKWNDALSSSNNTDTWHNGSFCEYIFQWKCIFIFHLKFYLNFFSFVP